MSIQRTIVRLQQQIANLELPERNEFQRREIQWRNGRRVDRSVFDQNAFDRAKALYRSKLQQLTSQLRSKRAELDEAKHESQEASRPDSSDVRTRPEVVSVPLTVDSRVDRIDARVDGTDSAAWLQSTSTTRSSSTAVLEPWDELDADRCRADDPEVIAAAWDEDSETESQEGVGSFLEGAVVGGFSDNVSWSAIAGQTVMGFVPIAGQVADARDIIAAGKDVIDGEEGAWGTLGISTAAIIPGLDFLKGRKALKRLTDDAADAASNPGTDDAVDATLKQGIGDAEPDIVESAQRTGIHLPDVFIRNGVAHVSIELTSTLNLNDIVALKEHAKRRGASSILVDSGPVLSEKLAKHLMARSRNGKPVYGGTVEHVRDIEYYDSVTKEKKHAPVFRIRIDDL
ncbi:MAG: hypothetical protein AAF219_04210 [Myxococcota bacterium]